MSFIDSMGIFFEIQGLSDGIRTLIKIGAKCVWVKYVLLKNVSKRIIYLLLTYNNRRNLIFYREYLRGGLAP